MVGEIKALALLSGGLDSILSAKIILDQGVQVEAVYFVNAFLAGREQKDFAGRREIIEQLGIRLHILDISQPHLELVQGPRYGYGQNLNPCIDCRILMLKKAKQYMETKGFSFLISGEVLGQRPLSQRKDSLNIIDRDAGVRGLILRPLSAKKLVPTLPEEKGWVKRDELFDFSGRSRRPQLALARKLGITKFLTPAGGCLLTESEFAGKFRDLLKSGEFDLEDVQLLKLGRHFRLNKAQAKIIVGRDEEENRCLLDSARNCDTIFKVRDFAGPITVIRGDSSFLSEGLIENAARLTARYSKGKDEKGLWVDYWPKSSKEEKSILVSPAGEGLIKEMRI